ncbi:MAG: hypothetical protein ABI904_03100 [Chloroflexota bacterium]
MKLNRIILAVTILMLASLACNAIAGGKNTPAGQPGSSGDQVDLATAAPTPGNDNSNTDSTTVSTDFPMTSDAYQVTNVGDGSLLYYTKMSMDDVLKFYRDEYTAKGYKERELLTTVTGGVFSIVFDGDPSGKAVVIQSVDLGDGSRTIAIRLEEVPQ